MINFNKTTLYKNKIIEYNKKKKIEYKYKIDYKKPKDEGVKIQFKNKRK